MELTTLVHVLACLGVGFADNTDVTVTSEAGTFIGFREEVQLEGRNVTMSKFLGIPYAKPPVGDLRFRKPVAKPTMTEPYTAQSFGHTCLQFYSFFQLDYTLDSEDCLYLDIVKPETVSEDEQLPVMVWIHGGGFILGSSNGYNGDALAASGPVIFVKLNYRLTAWGFLSTGDSNAPGNYGLWDQHLALKWVNHNIAAFGGDPKRVTIFGNSAGSAATIFQGIQPRNKELFQRILAQSGAPSAAWAIRPNPLADAKRLASFVNCDTQNIAMMVDCLRKSYVEKINATVNDENAFEITQHLPFAFVPVVDGDFVPVHPTDALDVNNAASTELRQQFASNDLMIGFTAGEGGAYLSPLHGIHTHPEDFMPNKTFFDTYLVPYLVSDLYGKEYTPVLNELVIAEYTAWDDPTNPERIRQEVCDMYTGYMFLACTHRAIKAHSSMSNQPSFLYHFSILPYVSNQYFPRQSWTSKPVHGDELGYVFGNKIDMGYLDRRELQQWEKTAAENMMTLWTNFANTGNPNQPRDIGVDWLPYTPAKHRYLEIQSDVTASRMKERLNERRATFWDTILPAVAEASRCDMTVSDGTCTKENCSP